MCRWHSCEIKTDGASSRTLKKAPKRKKGNFFIPSGLPDKKKANARTAVTSGKAYALGGPLLVGLKNREWKRPDGMYEISGGLCCKRLEKSNENSGSTTWEKLKSQMAHWWTLWLWAYPGCSSPDCGSIDGWMQEETLASAILCHSAVISGVKKRQSKAAAPNRFKKEYSKCAFFSLLLVLSKQIE